MTETFVPIEPGPLIDRDLELVLVKTYGGDKRWCPCYYFDMRRTGTSTRVGIINLRIGTPAKLKYAGHIGYEVDERYRGNHYAARASMLVLPLARAHGLKYAWLNVDPHNAPSIRTCEILGAEHVETVRLPKDHERFTPEAPYRRRYRLSTSPSRAGSLLVPHHPHWQSEFLKLEAIYRQALGQTAVAVEHVGSTAVKGLLAKPILDIDVVIPSYRQFPRVRQLLEQLGYRHEGDKGIRAREAFARNDDLVPRCSVKRLWMEHHLYVCPADSPELRRHIAFRNALRSSRRLRDEYARLKTALAVECDGDRKLYAKRKETEAREFIERVLESTT